MVHKIAVFMGGRSAERAVSLKSGAMVKTALESKNYEVQAFDPASDFVVSLLEFQPDLAFIALHGAQGEDGAIQGFLEVLQIPYTGCGILASSITMDKVVTKKLLSFHRIATPPFLVLNSKAIKSHPEQARDLIRQNLDLPLVVKAPTQGSTIGIYFVTDETELIPALEQAAAYGRQVLAERMLSGKEITVGLLGNDEPQVLPLLEIIARDNRYDYEAKYTKGLSRHIIPARVSANVEDNIRETARKVFTEFGLRGFARVDFIVENEVPYVLEINSIPGLTELSLFPDAARAAGIDFADLMERIALLAME